MTVLSVTQEIQLLVGTAIKLNKGSAHAVLDQASKLFDEYMYTRKDNTHRVVMMWTRGTGMKVKLYGTYDGKSIDQEVDGEMCAEYMEKMFE